MRERPVPVRILRMSDTMEMIKAPRKAGPKPATEKCGARSQPVNSSRSALMTNMNKPKDKMTRGSDSQNSSGRTKALRMPRRRAAATRSMGFWYWIPLTMAEATSTAAVVISQRCRNSFSLGGIFGSGAERFCRVDFQLNNMQQADAKDKGPKAVSCQERLRLVPGGAIRHYPRNPNGAHPLSPSHRALTRARGMGRINWVTIPRVAAAIAALPGAATI